MDRLQRRNCCRIVSYLSVISCQRSLHIRIVRVTAFRQFKIVVRLIHLLEVFVGDCQQHLGTSFGFHPLRSMQKSECAGIVSRSHVQVSHQQHIVPALWIGRNHLLQKMLSIIDSSHQAVSLRQPGKSFDRGWSEAKSVIVSRERELIISIESRRIAQQELEMCIVRRRLRSFLRILYRESMIALLQRFQRRVRQASILNV